MENKSKKSKAVIITIIVIIILLIIGYFLFKNRDNLFGIETSGNLSKIFSSLDTSNNSQNAIAQAGEDIKKGDSLSTSGTNINNNPIVIKANGNSNVFGFANEDIGNGEMGEITINSGGDNSFWGSFSGFLGDLFTPPDINIPPTEIPVITPPEIPFVYTPQCSDEKDNDGDGLVDTDDPNRHDADGNYLPTHYSESTSQIVVPPGGGYTPACSDTKDNDEDNLIDETDPNCHDADGNYLPTHYSESSSPIIFPNGGYTPECSDTKDNDTDTFIDKNDPNCLNAKGEYLPLHYSESTSQIVVPPGGGYTPACSDTKDNDEDTMIDTLDPNCHTDGNPLNEESYVPKHYSESVSPFTPPEGDDITPPSGGTPDLTIGSVTPTSSIVNSLTRLSATVTNIGDGSTKSGFYSYFAITKTSNSTAESKTDDGNNEGAVSKSGLKNIIVKIYNKIISISKATAAVTTTGDDGIPNSNVDTELSVMVPTLTSTASRIIFVRHTFSSSGTYKIRACADKKSSTDAGTITESNEENNCGPWTIFIVTKSLPTGTDLPECSDKIDNDTDEKIDIMDPNCHMGGVITGEYVSTHDSESTSPTGGKSNGYQCGDLKDNDGDLKIDIDDPNCHTDGDIENEYIPTHDDERNSPTIPEVNACLLIENNPLTFTDAEKAELAQLLRKFYLIAPTLKTDEDISLVYSEIAQYENFTEQIDGLIDECYEQGIDRDGVKNPNFTLVPAHRFGNPWFKPEERGRTTMELYTRYEKFDKDPEGWGTPAEATIDCKLVSGYYSGTTDSGEDCDTKWSPTPNCNNIVSDRRDFYDPEHEPPGTYLEYKYALSQGCKWNPGTYFDLTEYLLNIW